MALRKVLTCDYLFVELYYISEFTCYYRELQTRDCRTRDAGVTQISLIYSDEQSIQPDTRFHTIHPTTSIRDVLF